MFGTNQLPKFAEDSYLTTAGWWLIPTSEVTLTNALAIAGKTRLSALIRTPQNLTGTYEWAFARATLYEWFADLVDADKVRLGIFYLEDVLDVDEQTVRLRMTDRSLAIEDQL